MNVEDACKGSLKIGYKLQSLYFYAEDFCLYITDSV